MSIPDGKTTLAKRLRFDVKSFNDSSVELNEDFMLQQAIVQAETDLLNQFQNERTCGQVSDLLPTIKPSDMKLLVHLWVRGTCKHLVDVYQKTECDMLRDAVRAVLSLPSISIRDL